MAEAIPEKLYYSISEVSQLVGVKQYVLRFWETEFPALKPKKNSAGNRAYQHKEIELAKQIKYLLYEKGFTIEGARNYLKEDKKLTKVNPGRPEISLKVLKELRKDLQEVVNLLT